MVVSGLLIYWWGSRLAGRGRDPGLLTSL